jgi:tetratricopeptide (TPR) repeat protein
VREATLLLQAQGRTVRGAARALVERDAQAHVDDPSLASAGENVPSAKSPPRRHTLEEWHTISEQVLRVCIAALTSAPIHKSTLTTLRATVSLDDRARATDALVEEIRKLGVSDDTCARVGREVRTHLEIAHGLVDDTPRPSLITALASIDTVLPRPAPAPPPRALLRLRATSVDAAHALAAVVTKIAPSDDLVLQASSSDELIVTSSADPKEGVARLVRAASQWYRAVENGLESEIAGAIVLVSLPVDGRAVRAAHVHAAHGLRRPGLIHLDEAAFQAAEGLAEHPSFAHHIVPGAAFGHDRWQLSALISRSTMHGRAPDVASVVRTLTGSVDEARLVVIQGAPGLGKSTVLRRALVDAGYGDARAPVLWGAADPLQPTPYAPIAAMLRALAGTHVGTLHPGARLRRLLQGLADVLPPEAGKELLSLEKILAYLIGAADDEDDERLEREVEELSPRALRVAVRRALLLVVEGLRARGGMRPAAFVISGADAIDAPTIDLLTFLARRLAGDVRVFLLSSSRMRLPRALIESFAVERIELAPLGPEDSLEVLGALLDGEVETSHLAPIVEKARGAPLHLSQMLRHAVESGLISHDGRRWDVGVMKPSAIPARIERVIEARVARLPEVARRTLGFAAVLGSSFMPAAVEVIGVRAGIAREEIGRALNLLLETGFLVRSANKPAAPVFVDDKGSQEDPLLAFEHPLLRQVIERVLPADELAHVHGLAAEALLALLPSGTRAIAVQLARHLRVAGERTRALHHLALAVRRAVRLNNRSGAITMAKEGLALVGESDADRQFAFQLELERALDQGNDRDAHKVALKDLVRIAERTQDPRRQGQALHRVARFNVFGGDHEKAETAALRALDRFRACDDKRGQAQAFRVLALARFEQHKFEAAKDALTSARALLGVDDVRSLAILDHQLGLMQLEAGDAVIALEHLMDALAAKRVTGDPAGEGACMVAIADAYVRLGRLHTAAMLLERTVELAARLGDEAGRAESTKSLAEVMLALGDAGRARDLASSAQRLAKTLDLERLERGCTVLAARAELMLGDPIAAEHLLDNVRRRVDEKRDPFAAMEAALFSAQAKLARASRAQTTSARERLLKTALERAKGAASLGETHGYATGQVLGTAVIGGVLHALGDKSGGLLYAQRATELVDDRRSTGMPVEDVFLTHARILHALGDLDDARTVVERAMHSLELRSSRLPTALRRQFWEVGNRAVLRALKGHLDAVEGATTRAVS